MRLLPAVVPAVALCIAFAVPAVSQSQAAEASYPLTIEHAFGTTVLQSKPVRVATVAWANHEVPLALGIVPVGFARANFGDDDGDGVLHG